MIEVWVEAVGCAAPGLPDWDRARAVLRGETDYLPADLPPYQPGLLPPNERRRATPAVRQAFRAAEDAFRNTSLAPGACAAVFASSEADMSIIHRIGLALATPARVVSPIDFHNTVHNAAAGYWSIAVDARLPSSTVCAYDASFAAGLIEASTLAVVDGHDTLLVAYDVPVPELLYPKRAIDTAVGVALLLGPGRRTSANARLRIHPSDHAATATTLADPALEKLRRGNPAARALPLLRLLASGLADAVDLDGAGNFGLRVETAAP